jgi:hypothetical protein
MASTPGAAARLVAAARALKRPRWSQAFLAEQLRDRSFPASRDQIARLERSAPCGYDLRLLTASAALLSIPAALLQEAVIADYSRIANEALGALDPPGDGASG